MAANIELDTKFEERRQIGGLHLVDLGHALLVSQCVHVVFEVNNQLVGHRHEFAEFLIRQVLLRQISNRLDGSLEADIRRVNKLPVVRASFLTIHRVLRNFHLHLGYGSLGTREVLNELRLRPWVQEVAEGTSLHAVNLTHQRSLCEGRLREQCRSHESLLTRLSFENIGDEHFFILITFTNL